jgi:hypothetical protein
MAELKTEGSGHVDARKKWQEWLDDVATWKAGMTARPGVSAAELIIGDRRARR